MKIVLIPTQLLIICTFITGALTGCGSKPSEKSVITPEAIRDAIGGHPDAFGGNVQGWAGGVLPEAYWPEIIKKLAPIKIYSHQVNRVIALSQSDEVETGYYVYISISSYLPTSDEEWTFNEVGTNIWRYTRKRGEQGIVPNP